MLIFDDDDDDDDCKSDAINWSCGDVVNTPRTGGSLVEHWAVTREVVSSTPAGPTLRFLK